MWAVPLKAPRLHPRVARLNDALENRPLGGVCAREENIAVDRCVRGAQGHGSRPRQAGALGAGRLFLLAGDSLRPLSSVRGKHARTRMHTHAHTHTHAPTVSTLQCSVRRNTRARVSQTRQPAPGELL